MRERVAVVLFNLGGPDSLQAVRPFLFNLFSDPAIIDLPAVLRRPLAYLIARRRAPVARAIYERIGGASPLLGHTRRQAAALQRALAARGHTVRAFPCMRYWHPRSGEVVEEVRRFGPDRIVLLPLYPQFSTTTTGSSIADWRRAVAAAGLEVATSAVCCYPAEPGFVGAVVELIRTRLELSRVRAPWRLLFSAHGLPKRVIAAGDPYQWQVEATVAAIVRALGSEVAAGHVVCYQSRVGPLEWIGPSIEAEIARAAADQVAVVVVPVAFVSEHSETLVELDIEYREKAEELGVPDYVRVPTVDAAETFIGGLAALVEDALRRSGVPRPLRGERICPASFVRCPCTSAAVASNEEERWTAISG